MKTLMLGNEAVARGLYEGGCSFVSSYPGTPSTEITECAAKYEEIYAEWAPNEKVAMEAAHGASLAGRRSFCGMKHVGLNVSADPLFTISYCGVNAGMVIAVADDAGMHSSQNEQDSRHYARASKVPMLEPSDSKEALEFTQLAYELSEQFDTPVLIKMCTRVSHSQSVVEPGERANIEKKPYEKNASKYIMMPGNAIKRHPIVEERTRSLIKWAETAKINTIEPGRDNKLGIITSSTCYQYVKEALGDTYPVLKLGMIWPVPEKKIKDFADSVEELVAVEELDGFIESCCHDLGLKVKGKEIFSSLGELSQNVVADKFSKPVVIGPRLNKGNEINKDNEDNKDNTGNGDSIDNEDNKDSVDIPARPPVMCAGCPHRGLFYILKKLNLTVLGDIGCYTLGAVPPLGAMDSTVCMGASVSGIHGFNKAGGGQGEKKTVAVIGDSTFIHSGITGLINIAYNESASTVIILDNSITGMTGHQQNPTTGFNLKGDPCTKIDLETLCHAVGIKNVRVTDPYDLKDCENAIKEELEKDEASVIISRRPCALLKYVKHPGPISVDRDKCVGCKACMKIGCPAVSIEDGKAMIDNTLCVGCGVCGQMCKFGALG